MNTAQGHRNRASSSRGTCGLGHPPGYYPPMTRAAGTPPPLLGRRHTPNPPHAPNPLTPLPACPPPQLVHHRRRVGLERGAGGLLGSLRYTFWGRKWGEITTGGEDCLVDVGMYRGFVTSLIMALNLRLCGEVR